ncbi:MAG: serine/threonine-protein kinase [Verrucomicrobiota bacterium]
MPSTGTSQSLCPECGAPLDPSILGGTCPACLLGGILADEQAEQQSQHDLPTIPGYQILEEIGHGGMGIVYRAQQETPSRQVALKIVSPFSLRASEARARFLLEIDAMSAVEHPGLLPLYDAGEDPHGRPWLTMQLASPHSLAERISGYQADWQAITRLLIQLCNAIHYAHQRGILHRDLKPANILFDQNNHPLIADFGLAKWADQDTSFTRSSVLLGSPAYLAPETARDGSNASTTVSDVYGLGAILYELLAGQKPYPGDHPAQVLTQILHQAPPPPRQHLPKIPRDLDVIVQKAMAREPQKRYLSAATLAEDLQRWLDNRPILARPVSPFERSLIWARRNPALATLSLLLLASLLTGGLLLWQSNQQLKASLNEVENRVEFMTRELPASLAPLGRMDLLDEVFLNVAQYYENNRSTTPESLARHADFLTQWAQILKDRGQTDKMIKRLRLALQKAETASQKTNPSPPVIRARLAAAWRLAEVLIFSSESTDGLNPEKLLQARKILQQAKAFADKQNLSDLSSRVIHAQLTVELMILETHNRHPHKAIALGKNAKKQWAQILPTLQKTDQSSQNLQTLLNSTDVHYFLFQAYQEAGYFGDSYLALADWIHAREQLTTQYPGNLQFLHAHATATKEFIRQGQLPPDLARQALLQTNQSFLLLLSRDPSNVRWRTESVTVARLLAENSHHLNNPANQKKWMQTMSDRLLPLYQLKDTSYLKLLSIRRKEATYCAHYYEQSNWPQALLHFTGAILAQTRLANSSNSPHEHTQLQHMKSNLQALFSKHQNEAAWQDWLQNHQTE